MRLTLTVMSFLCGVGLASPAKTINCLQGKLTRQQKQVCKSVIDPMKAKRGEIHRIDCLESLEDGYQVGICEKVDSAQQKALSRQE